jgi:hypothetical protein
MKQCRVNYPQVIPSTSFQKHLPTIYVQSLFVIHWLDLITNRSNFLPEVWAISIPGASSDQNDAANMTPAANPRLPSRTFLCNDSNLLLTVERSSRKTVLCPNLIPADEKCHRSSKGSHGPGEEGAQESLDDGGRLVYHRQHWFFPYLLFCFNALSFSKSWFVHDRQFDNEVR